VYQYDPNGTSLRDRIEQHNTLVGQSIVHCLAFVAPLMHLVEGELQIRKDAQERDARRQQEANAQRQREAAEAHQVRAAIASLKPPQQTSHQPVQASDSDDYFFTHGPLRANALLSSNVDPSSAPVAADPPPTAKTTTKSNSRKRLLNHEEYEQLKAEESRDASKGLSLPKRQRTNTWGTDATHGFLRNGTSQRVDKRRSNLDEQDLRGPSSKRAKQNPSSFHFRSSTIPPRAPSISRFATLVPNGTSHPRSPHVTFAPTPQGSSATPDPPTASADPPSATQQSSRGTKREREAEESGNNDVADGAISEDDVQPSKKRHETRSPSTTETPMSQNMGEGADRERKTSDATDVEDDDAAKELSFTITPDETCRGKKPGDEWGSGGWWFKMDFDGKRLVRGRVKVVRPAFHAVSAPSVSFMSCIYTETYEPLFVARGLGRSSSYS
jgi:hypothetical protein